MPSKKCEAEGCNKWASFNLPGLKRPLYCRPHSTEGMVNVVSRQRCMYPDCPKQANFNHPGETRGLYCKEHIEEGMVDVRHKHCMHPGCPKQATCNAPGAGGGMFCGQHKLDGMVNVVLKRCAQDGCETFPSFGHPGQPGVQFCRLHKLPGMTRRTSTSSARNAANNVVNMEMMPERCAHPGCCEARPLYCMSHQPLHQHDPLGQPQMAPEQHLQPQQDHQHLQYANLHQPQHHQMQQQVQQQPEVHPGDHLQADQGQHQVLPHQLQALDGQAQMQHHLHASMAEHGIPAAYTAADMAAWQQSMAHALAGGDPTVGYDHRSTVPVSQDLGQVQYHQEALGHTGHPQNVGHQTVEDGTPVNQVAHGHQQV